MGLELGEAPALIAELAPLAREGTVLDADRGDPAAGARRVGHDDGVSVNVIGVVVRLDDGGLIPELGVRTAPVPEPADRTVVDLLGPATRAPHADVTHAAIALQDIDVRQFHAVRSVDDPLILELRQTHAGVETVASRAGHEDPVKAGIAVVVVPGIDLRQPLAKIGRAVVPDKRKRAPGSAH